MAKNTPPAEIAVRTPWKPVGAKPSAAVRLPPSKAAKANSAMAVTSGTAILNHTRAALASANALTPRKLMTVNTSISTAAAT